MGQLLVHIMHIISLTSSCSEFEENSPISFELKVGSFCHFLPQKRWKKHFENSTSFKNEAINQKIKKNRKITESSKRTIKLKLYCLLIVANLQFSSFFREYVFSWWERKIRGGSSIGGWGDYKGYTFHFCSPSLPKRIMFPMYWSILEDDTQRKFESLWEWLCDSVKNWWMWCPL